MSWVQIGQLEHAGRLLDLGYDLPDAPEHTPYWPAVHRDVTVPFGAADYRLVAAAFGVPLAFIDPTRAAAETRLAATEPDRWADDGGAP